MIELTKHNHNEIAEEYCRPCPYCGCGVNLYKIRGKHYIECKNMGCIVGNKLGGNYNLEDLIKDWNERSGV